MERQDGQKKIIEPLLATPIHKLAQSPKNKKGTIFNNYGTVGYGKKLQEVTKNEVHYWDLSKGIIRHWCEQF